MEECLHWWIVQARMCSGHHVSTHVCGSRDGRLLHPLGGVCQRCIVKREVHQALCVCGSPNLVVPKPQCFDNTLPVPLLWPECSRRSIWVAPLLEEGCVSGLNISGMLTTLAEVKIHIVGFLHHLFCSLLTQAIRT